MDGDDHTEPDVDPKLEALLRQELAVPRASEERTMDGLAVRLNTGAPRAGKIARPETGWRRHILAAAVMLALIIGLFALMKLTRGVAPVTPPQKLDTTNQDTVAIPNDKRETHGDEAPLPDLPQPRPQLEVEPAELTTAELHTLMYGIEAGNPSERNIALVKLSAGGLTAKGALEEELIRLSRAEGKKNEMARINEMLETLKRRDENEVKQLSELIDKAPKDKSLYLAPDKKLAERLQRKVTFDFVDTNMEEAMQFTRQITGIYTAIDPALAAAKKNEKISLRVTDMNFDLALDWIAQLSGLNSVKRGSVIILTTPERATRLLSRPQSYRLPVVKGEGPWSAKETLEVCELMPAGLISVIVPGEVNVLASDPDQASFNSLIKALELNGVPPAGPPAWMVEAERKLARKVTFDFEETTLEDAINFFNSLTKVNIIMDPPLTAAVKNKALLTLRVKEAPLSDALVQICQIAGVTITCRNDALFLMAAPKNPIATLCVFDLRPALKAGVDLTKLEPALKGIVDDANAEGLPTGHVIRSFYCGNVDLWTAQRINTVLEEAAKTGKIPKAPPAPWFFKTLKKTLFCKICNQPLWKHGDPNFKCVPTTPVQEPKKKDEF